MLVGVILSGVRRVAERIRAARQLCAGTHSEASFRAQAAVLAQQAELLDLALDAIMVWEVESGAIRFWNRGAEDMYGWAKAEVMGRTPQAVLHTEFPRPLSEIRAVLESRGRWEGELVHIRRDGTPVIVASRWVLRDNGPGQPLSALAINSNITEQKQAEAALVHQAQHDALTGLPNRLMLGERLQQALSAAVHSGSTLALLMLDLDRFKDVNDTLGHEWGDRLLREVGPRLSTRLRETDTLARLGGDEFAVLLPASSVGAAEVVARKVLESLAAPFEIGGSNVTVGGSVGIALYPEHGHDGETLLRCADVAMYVAKRSGSGHAVYTAAQDQHSRDRLSVVSDLRRAIECDELLLHYQPKLSCATGELAGVEALVRWQHPQRGLVPPDQFIPLAEQTGLIGLLGRRVLELALSQCREWLSEGLTAPVAVNLSMRDVVDPELPREIERLLAACRVPPELLRVEITESSLMVDPMRARATLTRLCELGVRLSVDDYGTGYSSLRYLQQLPVDELKIDRSFVRHMVSQPSDAIIVRSTIDLAHGLGLQVVAEGVEDAPTWQRLKADGCDRAQGYYMSKPLPAVACTAWLRGLEDAAVQLAA